jgi:hypothetical protein
LNYTRLRRWRAARLTCGSLALATLLLVGAQSQARRISIDFGANPESGDAWAFDSTGCEIAGTTSEQSCGVTFAGLNGTTGAIKLGFSVKIGSQLYDELFINKYGFVTFGIPFAIPDGGFNAASDLAAVQGIVSPVQNRPFIAPFYSALTIPDRDIREFNLRLFDENLGGPFGDFVGGSSFYRATSDPTPSDPAQRVPAFAVTWVDLDASSDPIYTQIVLYKNGTGGDFFLRLRYGNLDEDQYNTGAVQGVAGFSLETGVAADTVALPNPLGGLANGVPRDYFFSIVNGHVVSTSNADTDYDGVPDASDNCPKVANANQADLDHDGIGNVCDSDRDGDGIRNAVDNCPSRSNASQADSDRDGVGDACDATPAPRRCDVDADGDIDSRDLNAIRSAIGTLASGPLDPRDYDRNGRIQWNDLTKCRALCTRTSCAVR